MTEFQECVLCHNRTDKCVEDALYHDGKGPLCVDCLNELEGASFPDVIRTSDDRMVTQITRTREINMLAGHYSDQWLDENGNPAGGVSCGKGFCISWQNGPLGRGADRKEPNGAFVETIIDAAKRRIEFYQSSKFACEENILALHYLNLALVALDKRTKERECREVEGTHGL